MEGAHKQQRRGCQMPSSSATKWRRRRCGGVYSTVLQLLWTAWREHQGGASAQWCYQPEGAGVWRRTPTRRSRRARDWCRRRSSTSRRSRAVVGQVCGGVGHEGVRVPTTVKQVLMYMSHMSRTRERACLAHRGERREGRQKSVAKNRSTCRRQYSTQQTV
jgi:hypothetical protein